MWQLNMLLYKNVAVKCKVHRQTAAGPLFYHCHHVSIAAANGEITKVINGFRKGGNHEEPAVAQLGQITLQSHRVLSLSAYDNVLHGRQVWLVSYSQHLFSCMLTARSTGKKVGYVRLIKVWPHKTRRIAAKIGEYAKYSLLAIKIDLAKYAACSAWNIATLNHMKQMPLNWITWQLISNPQCFDGSQPQKFSPSKLPTIR